MAHLGRVMRRLDAFHSPRKLDLIRADSSSSFTTEAPQVNLPPVDTQLNMHQFTSLFDNETDGDEIHTNKYVTDNGTSSHLIVPNINLSPTMADPTASPSQPSMLSTSPNLNPGEIPSEWSAVGHAATGKSGRVIHNLQEEIARLTRECVLYRSRAEETQRSNEALKIQNQNMHERLRNLEQVNETNLNSIARKDRKIEELRTELAGERSKRADAEEDANKTNETMREERENHHREQARSQEITKHYETQYEVLSSSTKRVKADFERRMKALESKVQTMVETQKTQGDCADRLDAIAEEKDREVEGLKENHEKLLAFHEEYKKVKDDGFKELIERAQDKDKQLEAALASVKETEAKMKWAIQLNDNQVQN
ncbi:hypothetical protein N7493_006795 [Penicillium malachiteum]|uniref:SWI5-dependent HO expression protein 3 n=1 Tax=Penicillium malachiteum TaxID=1324776 RepID=A0AAD6HJB7_9EURO|nr:hypothetical protein N7493_006795 [Penicillium malachiteum]